jgi:Zn-dependent protease
VKLINGKVASLTDRKFKHWNISSNDKPQRSSDVVYHSSKLDGKDCLVLMNGKTSRFFYLRETESFIWNHLDGNTSVATIADKLWNNDQVKKEIIYDFISSLLENGLVDLLSYSSSTKSTRSQQNIDPFFIRIFSMNPSSFVNWLYKYLTPFLKKKWLLATTISLATLLILDFKGFSYVVVEKSTYTFGGSTIFGLLYFTSFVSIPSVLFHEFCHALACRHYGVGVGKLGLGIYYVYPVLYVDTSKAWFADRRKRIIISAAGLGGTFFVGSLAFALWHFPLPNMLRSYLQQVTYFSFIAAAFNLSPFIRLDGYFILMDITNIPNLRAESLQYVKKLLHLEKSESTGAISRQTFTKTKRIFFASFGIICLVWTIAILCLMYSWAFFLILESKDLLDLILSGNGIDVSIILKLLLLTLFSSIPMRKAYIFLRPRIRR